MSNFMPITAAAHALGVLATILRRWEAAGRLIQARIAGDIGRLVLAHEGRLLRFGAELVFAMCEAQQVEVVIINRGQDSTFEEVLANDVADIITVFVARLYGSRSQRNRTLINVRRTVKEAQC
jgi:putative resolvase